MADLDVSIVSVDGSVWYGTATSVTSTTVEGEMGILYGRQPILAQMAEDGVVTVHSTDGEFLVFAVSGGFLSCTGANVIVMAEKAMPASDVSLEDVEKKLAALPEDGSGGERAQLRAQIRAAKRLAAA
ncbi:F0F1 ATP synthase subunit epsilon [Lawsonella clevelandensis]|uniref:ATP synthase epsilon chain n=1 Tax=Lawsonella clevelandensis TaxID=1528099 RepID=A0A0M4LYJ6_9ACTN|nr:F0F1 ATP synthase subunit epsilon [Lawsonella clevelandensis]ALE18607.1 hypothetical protein AL705_01535 [Lawsonella clevelandensis]ALE34272.1 hypothetical protein IY73_01560 [Lawsonella clevelandensis]MDU7193485.1 F0F1 ATP synthase subunit epsilon [Lawsonella clevelandensis]VHN99905.1 ATP synthase epsilon chain [Lawsonella clevelandensis]